MNLRVLIINQPSRETVQGNPTSGHTEMPYSGELAQTTAWRAGK